MWLLAVAKTTFHFDDLINGFWDITISGLVLGAIYALVALGYTLVYGVLRLINFAHSEVWMLGAFGSFAALWGFGVPTRLANGNDPTKTGLVLVGMLLACLLVSMLFSGIAAVVVETFAYRPLRRKKAPRLNFLIAAIGASFILAELVGINGAKHREEYTLQRIFEKKIVFHLFSGQVRLNQVIVLVVALGMMLGLSKFVSSTRTGRGIRAVAQDGETARLMGVNTDRIILITFIVGGMMAGAAAFFFEITYGVARFNTGFQIGVKSFTAAVLGGIGNIRGAYVGGILLGLIELYTSVIFADQKMGTVSAFVVLVLVLMFRPNGLLGESLSAARA